MLLLFVGCRQQPQRSMPSSLSHHWLSDSDPEFHGLILRPDGRGRFMGASSTSLDGPVTWYVENGKLMITEYGEEGESGGPVSYEYKLNGDKLLLVPSLRTMSTLHRNAKEESVLSDRKLP